MVVEGKEVEEEIVLVLIVVVEREKGRVEVAVKVYISLRELARFWFPRFQGLVKGSCRRSSSITSSNTISQLTEGGALCSAFPLCNRPNFRILEKP